MARTRDAVLAGDAPATLPREVVSESWRRSLAAHVDPDHGGPPLVYEHREITRVRDGHPLAAVLPLLRDTLVSIADEAMHMMIVTDARGLILWREGQRDVLRTAERGGLVEGTRWSEDSIGTNAMGTALAADHAVQIHSAEHLVRTYHRWTCAASPIHDPETGAMIGAVDVTGPARTFHPTTLALVVAAARLAEGHLATQLAMRDERLLARNLPHLVGLRDEPGALLTPGGRVLAAQPLGWLPSRVQIPTAGDRVPLDDGEGTLEPLAEGWLLRLHRRGARTRPVLSLPFLGAERAVACLNGRPVRLSLRHAELLTLLALHPEGFTADGLATALHGDAGKSVTVRAEVHRLRSVLDAGVVRTQPYRLQCRVDADFLAVREALADGRILDAARAYRGPLLPRSEAPRVREERELLTATLRRAVLDAGDPDALWALACIPDGTGDQELAERLVRALPDRDPRHAALAARLDTLR
jgi:GAF domain